MPSQQLINDYQALQRAFQSNDLKTCSTLLSKLKIGLIESGILLPTGTPSLQDLAAAREILEIGAFASLRSKDIPSFDRYFSQLLGTFYTDYRSRLPPSPAEFPLRGLHLVRLLTQNRIADFHATLESLPLRKEEIANNPYISHPVNLDRWMLEGSYSKVWNAREKAPTPEYKFFVDSLMGTIRNEIASCEEAAYASLPLKDAATLLFFSSPQELLKFAETRGWEVNLTAGTITFTRKGEEKIEIPKQKIISASLAYTRELEQIV